MPITPALHTCVTVVMMLVVVLTVSKVVAIVVTLGVGEIGVVSGNSVWRVYVVAAATNQYQSCIMVTHSSF